MTRDEPMDPAILAELAAIDAALAGDPVDDEFLELAGLTRTLMAERPAPPPAFTNRLDRRAEGHFKGPAPMSRRPGTRPRRSRRAVWWTTGAGGFAVAGIVAALVIVLGGGSNGSHNGLPTLAQATSPDSLSQHITATAGTSSATKPSNHDQNFGAAVTNGTLGSSATSSSAASSASPAPSPPTAKNLSPALAALKPTPSPNTQGRKTVQSARLQLNTRPGDIDRVAQEAFDVIGDENGIVNRSDVQSETGGGNATISLSVPTANLQDTMNRLSRLSGAVVGERDDLSQDVNDTYQADVRHLNDARARRTSLLKQLAAATTTEETDSLNKRISDNEAAIGRAENTLTKLTNKVGRAQISLTITGVPGVTGTQPQHHSGSGGAFGIHRGWHDAKRVLVVAGGVLVIALAVLIPLGLLAALGAWTTTRIRRRQREAALGA